VARVDHGMIRPEGRSRRGPQMSATPDSTSTNPEQRIADLQRQLAECRAERDEALRQQTATAEVLGVINSSPGDLVPVFDAILEKAHSLCGAKHSALLLYDGEQFHLAAIHAEPRVAEYWRRLGPLKSRKDDPVTQPMRDGRLPHFADVMADDWHRKLSPETRRLNEIADARTLIVLPLRKNAALLTAITPFHLQLHPTSSL